MEGLSSARQTSSTWAGINLQISMKVTHRLGICYWNASSTKVGLSNGEKEPVFLSSSPTIIHSQFDGTEWFGVLDAKNSPCSSRYVWLHRYPLLPCNGCVFISDLGNVYKISPEGKVFQRFTIADGDGNEPLPFKTEWATIKVPSGCYFLWLLTEGWTSLSRIYWKGICK